MACFGLVAASTYVATDTTDPPDQVVATSASDPISFSIHPVLRMPGPPPTLPTVVTTTTTIPPTTTTTAPPPTTTTAPPPPPPAPKTSGGPTDAQLAALRQCESGGNYTANTPPYYGAYQFSIPTWNSMGTGVDRADHASPAVQDDAARRLIIRSGWGQFPACSRKIGAR